MTCVYHRLTVIKELGLEVSTVRYDFDIGANRDAETMVFADKTGSAEVYFKSHGRGASKKTLDQEHEKIVKALKNRKLSVHM